MQFFVTYGSFGAVPGINHAVIRQGKQFLLDIVYQLLEIAARQVGAPNTVPEQYIAAYQKVLFPGVKA